MTIKYITTAIDYVNSVPHIGTAYEKIGADVLARLYRLQGFDVIFQMGNDEHSVNVQKAAKEHGLSPKDYCDQMRPKFENVWKALNISNDKFIQTSEERHHKTVKKLFQKIYDNGYIYEKDYEGWYCESCEAFYTDKDLVDELCPNHKSKPKWLKEKNFFFKLSEFGDFLLEMYQGDASFLLPEKRRNEVVQFIKQGLIDVSVSRSSFDWGIELPESIGAGHVVYVWFDALINYITGIGYGEDDAQFDERWADTLHVVGKDITRFHCVIWPAMLKAADLPLPKNILGHGFVYLKGEKMSKSLGNVVTPLDILEQYPDFGSDALRYYLLRGSSFGDDGDFTWDSFIERYNSELANGYGNLVSRTLGMVWRYQEGKVASFKPQDGDVKWEITEPKNVIKEYAKVLNIEESGDACFHLALKTVQAYITEVDQFIDQKAPWTLSKEGKSEELSVVLTTIVDAIKTASILLYPFIPNAIHKVWTAYGFDSLETLDALRLNSDDDHSVASNGLVLKDKKVMAFPRIDVKKVVEDKVENQAKAGNKDDGAGLIGIEDFTKVELKVGKVISAERVEGADKLLKLQVEIGKETRQIVAGIASHYEPEALLEKLVVVVTNLKPAEIRGVKSNGMLLAAKKGKKLFVVSPEEEIGSGAKVG